MRFKTDGMAGVCVTVLAIMGMILCGFALSVQESERVVTGYDYVTDVSGLFDYSEDPQYIPYNPSANWTGFYTTDPDITDGISYEISGAANSYPIKQETTQVGTSSTVNLSSIDPENPFSTNSRVTYWFFASDLDQPKPSDNTTSLDMFMMDAPNFGGESMKSSNVIAALDSLIEDNVTISEGVDVLDIDLGGTIAATVSAWDNYSYRVGDSALIVQAYNLPYTEYKQYTSLRIDLESGLVSFINQSGVAFTSSISEVTIAYRMMGTGSYSGQTLGSTLTITQYEVPDPIYINTNPGVTLADATVQWSNGYPVGGMDVLFRVPTTGQAYTNTMTIPLTNGPDGSAVGTLNVYITASTGGRIQVSLDDGDGQQSIDIGQWRNFILSLDFISGSYSVVPVTQFATFNDYTALDESRHFDRIDIRGTAGTVTWGYEDASLALGVVNTSVFMNTYGVVMTDPSLSISEYFPEIADIRLNFYSFALYGSSVTINGQTFQISDGAQINVPYEDDGDMVDSWHTLTNIYITFEDRTYITFVNDGYTADLGPTTTDTISFTGNWYFTTGLYEGYETTESYYEWTLDKFIFDSNGSIVVYLGLLALGTAIIAKIAGLRALDIVVIVCAGIFGYVMLGAFR